ncbi:MAG: hypothetical protein ABS948_05060 [Solibacillus sp.]
MRINPMPVLFTVGQVIIFPYYILWLKELSLTYTLFALLFAVHSFAAALGYSVCQRWMLRRASLFYIASGLLYLSVFTISTIYAVVVLQIALGMSQGYFRAWHVQQVSYKVNAVQHYLAVGIIMVALAFIQIIAPAVLIASFGVVLCVGGVLSNKKSVAT